MASDLRNGAYLAALLAHHFPKASPGKVADAVVVLQREARRAGARETRRCNEGCDDDKAFEAKHRGAEVRCLDALEAAGVGIPGACEGFHFAWVHLGGDPRGHCGALHIKGADGKRVPGGGFAEDGTPIF
jgi:hypothetical protein